MSEADDLIEAIDAFVDSPDALPDLRAPSKAETQYDKDLRVALLKQSNAMVLALRGIFGSMKSFAEATRDWLPTIDTTTPTGVAAPDAVILSSITDTTAALTWTQTGTVDGWKVFLYRTLDVENNNPVQTIAFADGADVAFTDLEANTSYICKLQAYVGATNSQKTQFTFVTEQAAAVSDRAVWVKASMITTARAAALAVANGLQDGAFLASEAATIGSGVKFALVKGGTRTQSVAGTDEVTWHIAGALAYDANSILIPSTGLTLDSASAATVDDTWWLDVRNSSNVTHFRLPVDDSIGLSPNFILSADTLAATLVTLAGTLHIHLPTPAFDTQVQPGGGGGGGGSTGDATQLINDMAIAFDEPARNPQAFGTGSGAGGFIQCIGWQGYDSTPSWRNQYWPPGARLDYFQPWLLVEPSNNHVDSNQSCLVKLFAPGAYYYSISLNDWVAFPTLSGWHDFNMASWQVNAGGLGIGVTENPTPFTRLADGTQGFRMPGQYPGGAGYNNCIHNDMSLGCRPANADDIRCVHIRLNGQLVPSGIGTFTPSTFAVLLEAGIDPFPTPIPGGYFPDGNGGRMIRLTDQVQTISMTTIRAGGGLQFTEQHGVNGNGVIDGNTAANARLQDGTWLAANLPPGYD